MTLLLLASACSTGSETPDVDAELDAHKRYLAACQDQTATYDACQTYCSKLTNPADRTDCYFQLAEAAIRWTNGDARAAVNLTYQICNSNRDFSSQCFRHALHEVAITCTWQGKAWMDDPAFQGGDRWSDWQACVAKRVLERQKMTCLSSSRSSYHNVWEIGRAHV